MPNSSSAQASLYLSPCLAAVVTACILKLCPEYGFGSIPAAESAHLISVTNCGLDSGLPSWKMNKWKGLVYIDFAIPGHAKEGPVCWVDWNISISLLDIKLSH